MVSVRTLSIEALAVGGDAMRSHGEDRRRKRSADDSDVQSNSSRRRIQA
jgi:hypothetical protein